MLVFKRFLLVLFVGCSLLCFKSADTCSAQEVSFPRIAKLYDNHLNKGAGVYYKYDLLVGGPNIYSPEISNFYISNIKNLNPNIIILDFYSLPYVAEYHIDSGFDLSTLLYDFSKLPQSVRLEGWPTTFMLNLFLPQTIEFVAKQFLKAMPYDNNGFFYDSYIPGVFDNWACEVRTKGPCITDANSDGRADTEQERIVWWSAAKLDLARRTRQHIQNSAKPNSLFMINGAAFSPIPEILNNVNGVLFEDTTNLVIDEGYEAVKLIDLCSKWVKESRQPTLTTLSTSSGLNVPLEFYNLSDAEKQVYLDKGRTLIHRMRLGLGISLMCGAYHVYDLHTNWRGSDWWYPEYDAPLGLPLAQYYRDASGLLRRDFNGGVVLLNDGEYEKTFNIDSKLVTENQSSRVCPNTRTRSYRRICPRLKQQRYIGACGRSGRCKERRRREIRNTCSCRNVTSQVEVLKYYSDVSSGAIGTQFAVPPIDSRILVLKNGPTKTGDLLPHEDALAVPGATAKVIEHRGDLVVHSGSNTAIDVRFNRDTGNISKIVFEGNVLARSPIGGGVVVASDERWLLYTPQNVTVNKTDKALNYSSSRYREDPNKSFTHQVNAVATNDGKINLDLSLQANSQFSVYQLRVSDLCLPIDVHAGKLFKINDSDLRMPVDYSAGYLAGPISKMDIAGLGININPNTAYLYDGRAWGSDCYWIIFAGHSGVVNSGQVFQTNLVLSKVQ